MEDEYDVVVLGTGLKECILSGILSVERYKVLHLDRNSYYGGASASLSLEQLYKRFKGPDAQPPPQLGSVRDYNIDLAPKFIMAHGNLVRILVHTDVTKYLEFKAVDGSYVLSANRIHKVPATDMEALKSQLFGTFGFFEKRRARDFFKYVQDCDSKRPETWQGMDLRQVPMAQVYAKYGLDQSTVDFIGHAIALHRDDQYLLAPALPTVEKIKLYHDSLLRFEGLRSPFIYPMYGLAELPQAFARLSAVYGGTYMLHQKDARVLFDDNGVATGVELEIDGVKKQVKAKLVVGDPSYFPGKTRVTSQMVRAVCIMSHPVPQTDNSSSCQVILPQKQVGRRSDIYISALGNEMRVAPPGKFVAMVSTTLESPDPSKDVAPGVQLLGPLDDVFMEVVDVHEPLEDGRRDRCFVSRGYDATSHFETTVDDVLDMYTRITGRVLDLSSKEPLVQHQET